MVYDQAQSSRIGQRLGLESPGIRVVDSTDDVEAPYQGQLVWDRGDTAMKIYVDEVWTPVA